MKLLIAVLSGALLLPVVLPGFQIHPKSHKVKKHRAHKRRHF